MNRDLKQAESELSYHVSSAIRWAKLVYKASGGEKKMRFEVHLQKLEDIMKEGYVKPEVTEDGGSIETDD